MRAAASTRVAGGGGAEGPSMVKYGRTLVLTALPRPITMGATSVARNHKSSGATSPGSTGAEEAGVGDGSAFTYSRVCGIDVNSLHKSHQK